MTQSAIATAADYADALLTARRFKTVLFAVVLFALLLEVTLFFLAWGGVLPLPTTSAAVATDAATQPAAGSSLGGAVLQYLTVVGTFVGLIAAIVLSFVLLLIATIMLVGRLIGVGRIASAYLWSVVLLTLLFPWQAVLSNPTLSADGLSAQNDFRIPGVLYTWSELSHPTLGAKFPSSNPQLATLRWARYVGFPLVAVVALLVVQAKSSRALKQALGEGTVDTPADVPVV